MSQGVPGPLTSGTLAPAPLSRRLGPESLLPSLQAAAVDLDGTLLDSQHRISAASRAAISAAREAGVHVILASSRAPAAMWPILENLGLLEPVAFVASQGAVIASYTTGGQFRPQQHHTVPIEDAHEILRAADSMGLTANWFTGDRWLVSRIDEHVRREARIVGINPQPGDISRLTAGPDKLMFMVAPYETDRLAQLATLLPPTVNTQISDPAYLEVTRDGIDKASAVRSLCQALGRQGMLSPSATDPTTWASSAMPVPASPRPTPGPPYWTQEPSSPPATTTTGWPARFGSSWTTTKDTLMRTSTTAHRIQASAVLMSSPVIAVLRAGRAADYAPVVTTLAEAGVRSIELTLSTHGTLEHLEKLRTNLPDGTELGVGTVTTMVQAIAAIEAGADFLVTPITDTDIVKASVAAGIPIYPGGLTPTELHAGWAAGATAVKVFPAAAVGPGYLNQLRGPFPGIEAIPSGGVGIDEISAWMTAGALAVSLGGPLIRDAFSGGSMVSLRDRAEQAIELASESQVQR